MYGDSNFSWQKGFGYFAVSRQHSKLLGNTYWDKKNITKKSDFKMKCVQRIQNAELPLTKGISGTEINPRFYAAPLELKPFHILS